MSRVDEIKAQMQQLQDELDGLNPHERLSARELARQTETSPSTAGRFKTGDLDGLSIGTVKKYMGFTRVCPLCGAASDPEAWGGSSTPPQAEGPLFAHRDPELQKYLDAQNEADWAVISAELFEGRKKGHWMWFVFPQIEGLGHSEMSLRFSIENLGTASRYMAHTELGKRYTEAVSFVQSNIDRGLTIEQIMGDELDAKKLQSSLTLMEQVMRQLGADRRNEITRLLDEAFQGKRCRQTIEILTSQEEA